MPSLTARYNVANGQIITEQRGNQHRFYRSDALGSTVSLYDGKRNKTDSFTYWPYGEIRSSSGVTVTKYKYIGVFGCRTQLDEGIYMRARVAQPKDGRWLSVDQLWPDEPSYLYSDDSPTSKIDINGTRPCFRFYLEFCHAYCKKEAKAKGWRHWHWHCDQTVEVTFYCYGLIRWERTLSVHCSCRPDSFPPGRDYRNCRQAYNVCVLTGGGKDRGRQCLNCLRRCENWGLNEWLKSDCRFWDRDSDFW